MIGTDIIAPFRYGRSASQSNSPSSTMRRCCSRKTSAETEQASSTAIGGASAATRPNAATTCSVSVTRSWTSIDARRAPTVADTSSRMVTAVSSWMTARPRISLIV